MNTLDAFNAQLQQERLVQDEIHEAAQMPAVHVNRMVLASTPEHVRIAFLERWNQNSLSVPRACVVMDMPEAEALLQVLSVAIAQAQAAKAENQLEQVVMDTSKKEH